MSTEIKNKRKNSPRKKTTSSSSSNRKILEQIMDYEKQIYDLEQLLDIAKSFCSTFDFSNLLESIVYICMAQMHVLGAEIFIRDFITEKGFYLETSKQTLTEEEFNRKIIPVDSPIIGKLLEKKDAITFEELKLLVEDSEEIKVLEELNPTLLVPLILKEHLNGLLVLQERIAIEDDTKYTDYEIKQIMSIASLAAVAINNATLIEMSSTDMMTHLKRKYYLYSKLASIMDSTDSSGRHFAVLMFDIDNFKKFNDTYGHECGDFVLITVADLIKGSLRDSDIPSRYGGEEFTVLLSDTNKKEAIKVAERIRSKIEKYDFVYDDQHLKVTISGGVSVFDSKKNPVKAPNEFVNQADKALYVSKNSGRNKVSFYEANAR